MPRPYYRRCWGKLIDGPTHARYVVIVSVQRRKRHRTKTAAALWDASLCVRRDLHLMCAIIEGEGGGGGGYKMDVAGVRYGTQTAVVAIILRVFLFVCVAV